MHIEFQPHTQQVANPEKSITQEDITDELQTSCLSAGNMDWIRESSDHAGSLRGTKMPEHMVSIENIDWPLLGKLS